MKKKKILILNFLDNFIKKIVQKCLKLSLLLGSGIYIFFLIYLAIIVFKYYGIILFFQILIPFIIVGFMFKNLFEGFVQTNIDNTKFCNFFDYLKEKNNKSNELVVFYPETISNKEKTNIIKFLKLLDIYSFKSRYYLLSFIKQITLINCLIFLFSLFILLIPHNNKMNDILWVLFVSLIYIGYFFYWLKKYSYFNIDKIYIQLINKISFRRNLTFFVPKYNYALSLEELFLISKKKKEDNFEKYISMIVQILLPISYISYLTFFIGFMYKGH